VQITNVTALGLDPQVVNQQRPSFVIADAVATLEVRDCSIYGVSFGIKVASSRPSKLIIRNNLATQLEDRASNGQGGMLETRPSLGHFVLLNGVNAQAGAEIAWNQVVQAVGQSSTEDVINIYRSVGSPGHPIWIHDNYIEGNSSPSAAGQYTGSAIISDGSAQGTQSAYVLIQANEVVHTANSGIAIASGHDITAIDNRIISCGKDSSGNWFATKSANAITVYNAYGAADPYNIVATGNVGGLVRPDAKNDPMKSDIWVSKAEMKTPGNSMSGNHFTDPCFAGVKLNLDAEGQERFFWKAKLLSNRQRIGDLHLQTR
jgi:hypothetical protein